MNKKFRLQAILLTILLVIGSINALPLFYFNTGECAFEPGCDPDGGSSDSGLYVPSGSGIVTLLSGGNDGKQQSLQPGYR